MNGEIWADTVRVIDRALAWFRDIFAMDEEYGDADEWEDDEIWQGETW